MATTLGRYELLELLGQGASGRVYRGRGLDDDSAVAIKVLRSELMDDEQILTRFVRERNALINIEHPNLVRVFDLVVDGGSAAIVMELVTGGDLRGRLTASGAMSPRESLLIAAGISSGLAYAHERGIVHRDIKPENVLLTPKGEPKVVDFGIARLTEGRPLTRSTGVVGTPDYLAPELALGESATPAADVYSMGIVLYELLTGFPPFSGGLAIAVLRRHIDESPAPIPGLAGPIWSTLQSLLAKEPVNRPSAAEAAVALRQLAINADESPVVTPLDRRNTGETRYGDDLKKITRNPAPSDDSVMTPLLRESPPPRSPIDTAEAALIPTVAPPGPSRGGKRLLGSIAAAVTLIAVTAAVLLVVLGGNARGITPVGPLQSPVRAFPAGVYETSSLSLDGTSDTHVSAEFSFTNHTSSSVSFLFPEVIPDSIAKSPGALSWQPPYSTVLNSDPVVAYKVTIGPRGSTIPYQYSATIANYAKAPTDELSVLVNEQFSAESKYLRMHPIHFQIHGSKNLASLSTTPQSLTIKVGQRKTVTLKGFLGDGKLAPSSALSSATWTSTNSAQVTIVGTGVRATFVARRSGVTVVVVAVGKIQQFVSVTVLGNSPPPANATVPGAIGTITVTHKTSFGATLNLTAPSDDGGSSITGYQVTTTPNSQCTFFESTKCRFTNLSPGTKYSSCVRAVNAIGMGPSKCAPRFTTLVRTPGAPLSVGSSSVGTTTATISWSAPSASGGGVIDYYKVSGGSGCKVLAGSCSISGLPSHTFTKVCVRAHNAAGFGPTACTTVTTKQVIVVPSAPWTVSSSNVGTTTATISWGGSISNGGANVDFYTVSGGSGCQAPSLTCNITGLPSHASTQVCVRAHNIAGYGPTTCINVITKQVIVVPSAPTSVGSSNVGTTTATISWGAPSSNGGATVDAYLVSGGSGCQVTGGSCGISGLPSNATTQVCVRAHNSAGYGPTACINVLTARPQYGPYQVTGATRPVNIRSGPGTNYPIIGTLAPGQTFYTFCQASGSSVNGNVWWDQLTTGGYFSDWWTNTPGQGPPGSGIPAC